MASDALSADFNTSGASLRGWYGAILFLLAIILVMPIWLVENPPLVDYPNHLARGYILFHYDEVPTFRAYYEIDYLSTPSLAMDIFMVAAQTVCGVRTAGKLFLTLTLWLWLLGWHLLGQAIHGKPTWLALGGVLDAYHSMFFYGFTNFTFSLGVFLIALAAWFHGRTHWGWPRHVLVALLALACFFAHLSAFIFLAGSVLAVTAWECTRARRISRAATVNVLSVFVPLSFLRGGGQSDLAWDFPSKIIGALTLFRGYDRYLDVAYIIAFGVFVILAYRCATRVDAVGSVLFTGLGCVIVFLVGPSVLFGGSPADARFLPVAAALITLSLQFTWRRKRAWAVLTCFLGLVAFRLGMISYHWHEIDADLAEQVALFAELPEEAKVYPIVKVSERADERKRELPSFHVVCYAVIDRQAYTPTLLAFKGHTPIQYKTPPPRIMDHADPEPFRAVDKVDWQAVFANHDYLWCCRIPADYRSYLEKHCTVVAENEAGSIWRVPNRH